MKYIFIIIAILIGGWVGTSIYLGKKASKVKQYNTHVENWNNDIEIANKQLLEDQDFLLSKLDSIQKEVAELTTTRNGLIISIEQATAEAELSAEAFEKKTIELAQTNIEHALEALSEQYQDTENNLRQEYEKILKDTQYEISCKIFECMDMNQKLSSIKSTFAAAQEAQKREELIQANPKDYSLNLSNVVLADIHKLLELKDELNNPRILLMLIWQTYIRTPLNTLCNKVIGAEDVCGIYKLTNLKTKEVYIGQSVKLGR